MIILLHFSGCLLVLSEFSLFIYLYFWPNGRPSPRIQKDEVMQTWDLGPPQGTGLCCYWAFYFLDQHLRPRCSRQKSEMTLLGLGASTEAPTCTILGLVALVRNCGKTTGIRS